jgi:parvulin-like peptidyl-prolyl isomerase
MRIAGGEKLEDLAREHSDCPENGGYLGTFPRGQMVREFEEVVFAMQPGEVSDVFLTQFGYHVAKLHERIEPQQVPFEEVRDRIAEHLREQRRTAAVEAFVDSLKAKATIEEAPDEPAE